MIDDNDNDNRELDDLNRQIKERELSRQNNQANAYNDNDENRDAVELANIANHHQIIISNNINQDSDSGDIPASGILDEQDKRKTILTSVIDQAQ